MVDLEHALAAITVETGFKNLRGLESQRQRSAGSKAEGVEIRSAGSEICNVTVSR
jgi:hypothetical protein